MAQASNTAPAGVRPTSLGSVTAESLTCWIGAELKNVSLPMRRATPTCSPKSAACC